MRTIIIGDGITDAVMDRISNKHSEFFEEMCSGCQGLADGCAVCAGTGYLPSGMEVISSLTPEDIRGNRVRRRVE